MLRTESLAARCGVAMLSGVAYALAFPPLGWRWLMVLGIAGLIWSLEGMRGARARGIGFLFGMVAFALGLPWLWLLFGAFATALWAILAAFTAAFAWMQSRAEARGVVGWKWVIFTLVNWSGWEFIRAEVFPLKFPWMTAGLAWGPNRLVPWVGVYSAGLVVVFLAICLVRRRWWPAAGTLVVIFALTIGNGLKWTRVGDEPDVIPVAGVQYEGVTFERFLEATSDLPTHNALLAPARIQHVVWPEDAVPYDVRTKSKDWAALLDLCREHNITLTLGTQTRTPGQGGWYNTALTLDATGVLGTHYKVHPVHFFDDGTPGTTTLPISTSHGRIGTPICFDCDYEGVVRGMTAAGAEAFIVPMMDADSWGWWQHVQHAELFRIRACENGRWLFVCGSSGVSQMIDSRGEVRERRDPMEQVVLTGFVRRESVLTFYTRWGWLTPWLLLGAAIVCWIALLLPRRAAKDTAS